MRLVTAAPWALALLVVSSTSVAQESVEAHALELKHDGDAALVERRYVDALAAYDQSYAVSPSPAILYNRGRALQFLARYPEALDAYERFAQDAPPALRAKAIGLDAVLDELRGKVATIKISVDGSPTRILVGARDVGLGVLHAPFRVNAGPTTIEVLSDEDFNFRREVVLPPRMTTNVDAKLTPRHTHGYLVVASNVDHANVFIDQKLAGLVPLETALLPGTHPVRVAHDGYESATTTLAVQPGQHYDLLLNPIKRAPITSRPWFWGVVGTVVVGVVVASIVAATQEGVLPSGNFSPGQLRK